MSQIELHLRQLFGLVNLTCEVLEAEKYLVVFQQEFTGATVSIAGPAAMHLIGVPQLAIEGLRSKHLPVLGRYQMDA